ncbi:hypothetical protein GF378_02145 [Candidatus Pacearchaeota archaeon]|nr:hypothetical protein [Candidatus Pacearchaeota archaeon]
MNLEFYIEKLNDSEEYKKFLKKNKDAFLASAFFVIDKKGNDNKQHFDYFIPSKDKMFSFSLENGCKKTPVEMVDKNSIKKENAIDLEDLSIDFDKIEERISNEMQAQKVKNKIHKLLLSLQKKDNKDYILATVFISNMGLLKVTINLDGMKIEDFEKKSFMDFLKIEGKGKKKSKQGKK